MHLEVSGQREVLGSLQGLCQNPETYEWRMETWFIEEDVRETLKGFFESLSLCSIYPPTVVGFVPKVVAEDDAKRSHRFCSRQNTLYSPLPKSAEDGERAVE